MRRLVEIRSYTLRPHSRARFDALLKDKSLPLLQEAKMEVVAFGPSQDDPDGYYLMRAFDNEDHLVASQDAFYGSAAWRHGPRESMIELIVTYTSIALWLSMDAIEAIRRSHDPPALSLATS